jgi:hypothetical protein
MLLHTLHVKNKFAHDHSRTAFAGLATRTLQKNNRFHTQNGADPAFMHTALYKCGSQSGVEPTSKTRYACQVPEQIQRANSCTVVR